MDRAQLKENAKKVFHKNYWHSVIVAFLMTLGAGGVSRFNFDFEEEFNSGYIEEFSANGFSDFFSDFLSSNVAALIGVIAFIAAICGIILSIFVFSTLRCGGIRYFMKLRRNHKVEINEVVANFRDKTFLNIAKISFLEDIYIMLWSLLFIIPGIIKAFEYWAIDYILAVRPDLSKDEAFRLSKTIMNGNKLDLFVLELSFLGWTILSLFTFSLVGVFYANPYIQATYVEFFDKIRNEAIIEGRINPFDVPDYQQFEDVPPTFSQYQNTQNTNTYYQNNSAQQPPTAQNIVYKPEESNLNDTPEVPHFPTEE
ncbi:MAG: DUF975 family protein [Acutalibacteraceae bacterium]